MSVILKTNYVIIAKKLSPNIFENPAHVHSVLVAGSISGYWIASTEGGVPIYTLCKKYKFNIEICFSNSFFIYYCAKILMECDYMDKKIMENLINTAKEAANQNFCCPYSKFTVGAALLAKDGKVYKGFNIENVGVQSICAERVAFTSALTDNQKEFSCLVVVGKKVNEDKFIKTLPCGYCRQFIKEYTKDNFMIYTYDDEEEKIYSYSIEELLPESFTF